MSHQTCHDFPIEIPETTGSHVAWHSAPAEAPLHRHYFHQKVLSAAQLDAWRRFLDFEECGRQGAWVIKCPHVSHHPTIRYMVYKCL